MISTCRHARSRGLVNSVSRGWLHTVLASHTPAGLANRWTRRQTVTCCLRCSHTSFLLHNSILLTPICAERDCARARASSSSPSPTQLSCLQQRALERLPGRVELPCGPPITMPVLSPAGSRPAGSSRHLKLRTARPASYQPSHTSQTPSTPSPKR